LEGQKKSAEHWRNHSIIYQDVGSGKVCAFWHGSITRINLFSRSRWSIGRSSTTRWTKRNASQSHQKYEATENLGHKTPIISLTVGLFFLLILAMHVFFLCD
jgi:hypothetical protein